jgi:D-glycero-beta-D-manno-heptose 1-phosphate adenylyltransferase
MGLILTGSQLSEWSEIWRQQELTVVLTNGCYDLIHVGHLRTFREAKKFGDILVVGINSDSSIRNLKGPSRPLISQEERSELVAALEPVDFVTVFDELTANGLLENVRPQIYVKGGDYTLENLPERETILRLQVKVNFVPLVLGISTTELLKKIENGKMEVRN